jgi:hypothetical protein
MTDVVWCICSPASHSGARRGGRAGPRRVDWELWTSTNDGCGNSCDRQATFKVQMRDAAVELQKVPARPSTLPRHHDIKTAKHARGFCAVAAAAHAHALACVPAPRLPRQPAVAHHSARVSDRAARRAGRTATRPSRRTSCCASARTTRTTRSARTTASTRAATARSTPSLTNSPKPSSPARRAPRTP